MSSVSIITTANLDGTTLSVVNNKVKALGIAGGAANKLIYQTGIDTSSFVAAPTTGATYLGWTGSGFAWSVPAASSVTWSALTGTPTTVAGYGITDAQAKSTSLTNIAALSGTSGLLKATGAGTWALDTTAYLSTVSSSQVTTALGFTPVAATGAVANIAGGAANQIAYQTGSGSTSFISVPTTASTYLQWNGTGFTWATAGGSPTGTANTIACFNSSGNLTASTSYISASNQSIAIGSSMASNTNTNNNAFGVSALNANTTGYSNTAVGSIALAANTTGAVNSAVGANALHANTTGFNNAAVGGSSLFNNTTGTQNNALGNFSIYSNTVGIQNIGIGEASLYSSIAGCFGVAVGFESQYYANNQTTIWTNTNTSVGYQALMGSNVASSNTGLDNTAVGFQAGKVISSGFGNSALGKNVLLACTTGILNSGCGFQSLLVCTSGNTNVAMGANSLAELTTGINNFAIGYGSGWDALLHVTTQSNQGVLGNYTTDTITSKVALTVVSDVRDKVVETEIKVPGLDYVMASKIIAYRFRKDRSTDETSGRMHYGFPAQHQATLETEPVVVDTTDPEKLKMNKDDMIAILFQAVKDLKAEIEALKSA